MAIPRLRGPTGDGKGVTGVAALVDYTVHQCGHVCQSPGPLLRERKSDGLAFPCTVTVVKIGLY